MRRFVLLAAAVYVALLAAGYWRYGILSFGATVGPSFSYMLLRAYVVVIVAGVVATVALSHVSGLGRQLVAFSASLLPSLLAAAVIVAPLTSGLIDPESTVGRVYAVVSLPLVAGAVVVCTLLVIRQLRPSANRDAGLTDTSMT